MTTDYLAAHNAKFAERKAFAIAAIERLTSTDTLTMDFVHVIRAVAGLAPTDEADGALEMVADDLAHGVRVAVENVDPDLTFWNLADVHHDLNRGVWA